MPPPTPHALEVAREIERSVTYPPLVGEARVEAIATLIDRERADMQAKIDAAHSVIDTYIRTFGAIEALVHDQPGDYIVDQVRSALDSARREAIEECITELRKIRDSHVVQDRDASGSVIAEFATESSVTAEDCMIALRSLLAPAAKEADRG